MQQSTRRRASPVTPRTLASAAACALALCAAATFADGGDGADARVEATAGLADDEAMRESAALRPRWVAPQRGDGLPLREAEAVRDWRSGARIIVHAVAGESRLAAVVEGMLGRLGGEEIERRVVAVPASTDQVRFFHEEDAAMARELATALEPLFGDVRVRDLTFYRPLPESGSLEVWLR